MYWEKKKTDAENSHRVNYADEGRKAKKQKQAAT